MPELTTERPTTLATAAQQGAQQGGGLGPMEQPTASAPRRIWQRVKAAVVGEDQPTVPLPARKLRRAPTAVEAASRADFARIEEEFTSSLDDMMAAWTDIQQQQLAELSDQITEAIDREDWAALGAIVPATTGVTTLADRMMTLANKAATTAVAEAAAQGRELTVPAIAKSTIESRATAIASILSSALSEVTARKALAFAAPGQTGSDVANQVVEYVNGLTDAYLRDRMTGALMAAQNEGRHLVWQQVTGATFYASELLDQATCDPCAAIDGTDYESLDDASDDYPAGGYVDCEGGDRCRGTLVAVMGDESAPGQGTGEGA